MGMHGWDDGLRASPRGVSDMNGQDRAEVRRLAEEIAERARQTAHALDITAGALDALFDCAVEAQSDPSMVILLYAAKALQRGRDALREDMQAAVRIYAMANHKTPPQPGDPELYAAMRATAERLHQVLEDPGDKALLLTAEEAWIREGRR